MRNNMLGYIVKNRRTEFDLSIRRLAALIGCNVKTISDIECGITSKPKIETLEKLSEILCIELEDILDYAGYDDEEVAMYYESDLVDIDVEYEIEFEIVIPGKISCLASCTEEAEDRLIESFNNLEDSFLSKNEFVRYLLKSRRINVKSINKVEDGSV